MRRFFIVLAGAGLISCSAPTAKETADAVEASATLDASIPLPEGVPEAPTAMCVDDPDGTCADNAKQFTAAWPLAWQGDYQAQRNVAFMQSQKMNGVQQNKVQGCAWRIVILLSGDPKVDNTDTGNFNLECGSLAPAKFVAAKASAETIYKTIKGAALPEVPAPTGQL